jgi:hypothetical protein
MNFKSKKPPHQTEPPVVPPTNIAIPDGKGGYTYEALEPMDLRKPRTPGILPVEVGTRRGVIAAPSRDNLQSEPTPANKL